MYEYVGKGIYNICRSAFKYTVWPVYIYGYKIKLIKYWFNYLN